MLIIRRRSGESILIGEDIEVQVVDVGGNRVKLGITAPKQIPVLRKEIQLIRRENEAAARVLSAEQTAELASRLRRQMS